MAKSARGRWEQQAMGPPAGGAPADCPAGLHPQFSLLSEVRGTISPQDLDRFDHLVLRREIESMKARQPPGPGAGDTYSVVSYSDTGSSTGSHGTSTTVSSARVSCPRPVPGVLARGGRGASGCRLCSETDLGAHLSATPSWLCPLPFRAAASSLGKTPSLEAPRMPSKAGVGSRCVGGGSGQR